MCSTVSPETFCQRLRSILSTESLVLFAGAGVGVWAGLPDWLKYTQSLVDLAKRHDPAIASTMKERIRRRKFIDAFLFYNLSDLIPQGDKLRYIAQPFGRTKYDSNKLRSLMALPFKNVVTTNFDMSLHDAWAANNGVSPICFELADESLAQAAFYPEFFIARIHGRAEDPKSMVLDTDHYKKLASHELYMDFVVQTTLSHQPCLFIGYSFDDPAIIFVLDILKDLKGPHYAMKHYALVRSDDNSLAARLAEFNIEVLTYEDHNVPWKCMDELSGKPIVKEKTLIAQEQGRLEFEHMRLFLASCYVRATTRDVAAPLRDQVMQGMLLSILERYPNGISRDKLAGDIRSIIPANIGESLRISSTGLDVLQKDGWINYRDDKIHLARRPQKRFEKNVNILVKGVLDRFIVKHGEIDKQTLADGTRRILEELFLDRGWDLAAEYAGVKSRYTGDIYGLVRTKLRSDFPKETFARLDNLSRSICDLLIRPNAEESQILSDMARISFGLSVVLNLGMSTLRREVIPERIYLDANVLMPLITEGHPVNPVYRTTLKKLSEVALESGRKCEVLVINAFLNEIVKHRRRGIELVHALNLDDRNSLERHVLYYGADNTNVFVGSYASYVANEMNPVTFEEFLSKIAPYKTETALADFLSKHKIKAVPVDEPHREYQEIYAHFERQLKEAYETLAYSEWEDRKADVLILHEIRQLAQLEFDLRNGHHSYFVTADRRLRDTISLSRPGVAWNAVISNHGLVQLIDLMVGLRLEPRSHSRMVWAIAEMDQVSVLKDYFVSLALKKHDEALLMAIPEIIDLLVDKAEKEARVEKIKLRSRSTKERARAKKFLDRFEEEIFDALAEEIKRRRRQESS